MSRLERLIGPAGPEVSCEECFAGVDRFVELEAAGRDAEAVLPGMREHLYGCPACAEEYASLHALLLAETA